MAAGGWVYIMADRYRGTIYTGVTAYLPDRITQHREGRGAAFTRTYGLRRLDWCEPHEEIATAILREKRIKKWNREWKFRLIEEANPDWEDLYERIPS
jgi:putative endonuclease